MAYYLRKLGISENIITHITDSGMGHIAVAWALYKVATPVRYAVTLGKNGQLPANDSLCYFIFASDFHICHIFANSQLTQRNRTVLNTEYVLAISHHPMWESQSQRKSD